MMRNVGRYIAIERGLLNREPVVSASGRRRAKVDDNIQLLVRAGWEAEGMLWRDPEGGLLYGFDQALRVQRRRMGLDQW